MSHGHPGLPLRIATVVRPRIHHSLLLYREAILPRLRERGIDVVEFAPAARVPRGVDLVWDPGLGMRPAPPVLFDAPAPVVVTVLGIRSFAVPEEEVTATADDAARERERKAAVLSAWARLQRRLAAVITISSACADDIVGHLGTPRELVHPIHLAVEKDVFAPTPGAGVPPRDYILHVAIAGAARKNLARMLEAYGLLPAPIRIPLVLKLAEQPHGTLPRGVRVVTGHLPVEAIADLYRGARLLLFPSIYEGFGLPILEAMSCGCPVVTSNVSACPEVSGGAALLVDPRSVGSIAQAMERLLRDDDLALSLSRGGLRRAEDFSWEACAEDHALLFRRIAPAPRRSTGRDRLGSLERVWPRLFRG